MRNSRLFRQVASPGFLPTEIVLLAASILGSTLLRTASRPLCMDFEPSLLGWGILSWRFGGQPALTGARLAPIGDCSFAALQPKEKEGEQEWKEQKHIVGIRNNPTFVRYK